MPGQLSRPPPVPVVWVLAVLAIMIIAVPACADAPVFAAAPGATVDELLARVRNLNPELAAAALERESAAAKIYPAGALDDPMVNL